MDRTISGKSVLVTGAGGSIGSALAKAIVGLRPRKLVLLDQSERNLHRMQVALTAISPAESFSTVLGDSGDTSLLGEIIDHFHPEIVYHAAAFKHVSMMESNPVAAIKNNSLGTHELAETANRRGISALIMISTDKAANPRSILGASKRLAEMALQYWAASASRMVSIRLGNVLGTDGSVVPLFKQQIADGEPVTVTHPEASRYFFSLDDAIKLILQVSLLNDEGGIFIPHVGAPVRIIDLARRLFEEAGRASDAEMPIVFTGLRPGEKLSEQFVAEDESTECTSDPRIFRVRSKTTLAENFNAEIARLSQAADQRDIPALIEALCRIVPSYKPSDAWARKLNQSLIEAS